MTSRERLLTAWRGGCPDRVPILGRMNKFLRSYYAGVPSDQWAARSAEEFGLDMWGLCRCVPLPIHSPRTPAWGGDVHLDVRIEDRGEMSYIHRTITTPAGILSDVKMQAPADSIYGATPGPEVVEPLIKDLARDVEKVRYMMPDAAGYEAAGRRFEDYRRSLGDRGVATFDVYSPLDCRVEDAMKQADFLTLVYDDESAFRELLAIGQEACIDEIRTALSVGTEVIHCWWFYAGISGGWSPRIYEQYFLPMVKEQVDLAHRGGALYIYYDDGKLKQILPFVLAAGADVVMTLTPAPVGDIDPLEVKETYGSSIALQGGFEVIHLVHGGTPDVIEKEVRETLPRLKCDGGYVFDTSNSIPAGTPIENVRTFFRTANELASY